MDRPAQLEAENKALLQQVIQMQSSIESLEKRLMNEEKYQESQQRFQIIFQNSMLGNKVIGHDLKIIQVNKALQKMLGYSEKELVGTRVLQYAHPDFVKPWKELQENLWEKQLPSFHIETCLARKDGSTFWCSVHSILFQDNGQTLGYTILEDISERKTLEVQHRKLYESQEIIVHTVAHDLKNPIHTIKTLGSFLKKELAVLEEVSAQKSQRSLTFIDMITDTCDKAYTIIKDLLLIGEIELGKMTLKKENTDMQGFLEPLLSAFHIVAKEKDIAIHTDFPLEKVYAQINRDKFTRAVENIVSNAIKFTNVGGQVTVGLKKESQRAILQVRDTGIGIPEALQSSVFNKFTKTGRLGTQGETTTGLGLYIVKQIIDLHKGKIWLESKENEGACFYIELE